MTEREQAKNLANFIEEWDRVMLECGMGDWTDSHELPDAERELIIKALYAFGEQSPKQEG